MVLLVNIVAWRGLACVAYSYLGAMRNSDSRNWHKWKTPTSFYFQT